MKLSGDTDYPRVNNVRCAGNDEDAAAGNLKSLAGGR